MRIGAVLLGLGLLAAVAPAPAAMAEDQTKAADIAALVESFGRADPTEHLPGGAATSRKSPNRNAFSHPSANMRFARRLDFMVGNGFFKKVWVSAPASTKSSDGLGPLFNARSCQRCHLKDGRGHPPSANWPEDTAVSMLIRLSIPPQDEAQRVALASHRQGSIPDPVYGGQLQDFGVQGHKAEGKIRIDYEPLEVELAGGETVTLRRPRYQITHLNYGPLHDGAMISPRVAPPMIGLGLLELIPEEEILAGSDPEDRDGDAISGRASRVWDEVAGKVTLGRFGWKAGQPSVLQQISHAFAGDMGISTPLLPDGAGDCSLQQTRCRKAPDGNSPQFGNLEAPGEVVEKVLFYSRHLAVPLRRRAEDPEVLAGKKVFYETGCVSCHRPSYVTGEDPALPELSGQRIWPYSDLLLHDLGEGLSDGRPDGAASGREWRTPPLWGIGLTKTVNGHTNFLHDGRARNLQEAILWHGGEAEAARETYRSLAAEDRAALIEFLNSL